MGAKGTDEANEVLDLYLRGVAIVPPTGFYLALLMLNPGPAEDMSSEVAAPEYARQPIVFAPAAAGATSNIAECLFPEALIPWGVVAYGAVVDTLSGPGRLMYYGPLSPAVNVLVGDAVWLRVGQGVVTES